jgi:hypothetical protein
MVCSCKQYAVECLLVPLPNLNYAVGLVQDGSLLNADPVVWYTFGVTHFVRPEDYPVMPCDTIGFTLRPVGFFEANPALVSTADGACHAAASGSNRCYYLGQPAAALQHQSQHTVLQFHLIDIFVFNCGHWTDALWLQDVPPEGAACDDCCGTSSSTAASQQPQQVLNVTSNFRSKL